MSEPFNELAAKTLYRRTADEMGFTNAPEWDVLPEKVKDFWLSEAERKRRVSAKALEELARIDKELGLDQ